MTKCCQHDTATFPLWRRPSRRYKSIRVARPRPQPQSFVPTPCKNEPEPPMPELPEVETVRRGLAPLLEGALLCRGGASPPRPAISVPRALCRPAQGTPGRSPRTPGEISGRAHGQRPRPHHAPGHDRTLFLRPAERRPEARPRRIHHVDRRAGHTIMTPAASAS